MPSKAKVVTGPPWFRRTKSPVENDDKIFKGDCTSLNRIEIRHKAAFIVIIDRQRSLNKGGKGINFEILSNLKQEKIQSRDEKLLYIPYRHGGLTVNGKKN